MYTHISNCELKYIKNTADELYDNKIDKVCFTFRYGM